MSNEGSFDNQLFFGCIIMVVATRCSLAAWQLRHTAAATDEYAGHLASVYLQEGRMCVLFTQHGDNKEQLCAFACVIFTLVQLLQ